VGEVVVVAVFRARAEHREEVERGLRAILAPTHAEDGCLAFALHRGADDPRVLVFVERWASRDHLAAHAGRPWIVGVRDLVPLLESPPKVHVLDPVPGGDPLRGSLGPA
jgi:quinol monooxygenase YgiN